MADFLIDHARSNVWCEPSQDHRWIVRPSRLTPDGGSLTAVPVAWGRVTLPVIGGVSRARFHVYQIGNVPTSLVNITKVKGIWRKVSDVCNENNLLINLYFLNGIHLPLSEAYFYITRDNNILLANRIIHQFADYETNPMEDNILYVRFYSNAYYNSDRWLGIVVRPAQGIKVVGQWVKNQSEFISFYNAARAITNQYGNRGAGTYFVDGYKSHQLTSFPVSDRPIYFEYIHDASIKKQTTLAVTALLPYTSTLDGETQKLIFLHGTNYSTIDYHDDVDFYLILGTEANHKGIYLHRNQNDFVRQLTHTAYGIKSDSLQYYVNELDIFDNLNDLKVMANIREAGFKRGLVFQNNRIEELYKLNYSEIKGAMSGVNATIPEWQANNLESSAYTEIMRVRSHEITDTMVESAYGYHAITRYAADPYQTYTANEVKRIVANYAASVLHPVDNVAKRSLWCYDANGKMIIAYNNSGVYSDINVPSPTNATTLQTELLVNRFGDSDSCFYPRYHSNNNTFTIPTVVNQDLKVHGYRVYACPIVGGEPNEAWYDITGNDNFYSYAEPGGVPTLTWNTVNLLASQLFPCVKINNAILYYQVPLNQEAYPGMIRFTVNSRVTFQGVTGLRPQKLSPGRIDLFADGENLMEGVDYKVIWPQIVVFRKPTRTPLQGYQLWVRCYGFCDPDTMEHFGPRDVGFIKNGLVSADGRYDIRNDRNCRIIVGGSLKNRTHVRFAEGGTGNLQPEGVPFTITDVISPIEHYTDLDTIDAYKASLVIDEDVENYLNQYIEETPTSNEYVNSNRWEVFSPFCSALIHALLEGYLDDELEGTWNNTNVETWVGPYEYLLPYDPCTLALDQNYFVIYPHQYDTAITLTAAQYTFIVYIIDHYLDNKINLTGFVDIEG